VTESVDDLLHQLVAATPPPPTSDDPDLVLTAFDAMIASRTAILHSLEAATPDALSAHGQLLVGELTRRDQAWLAALGLARHTVADRLAAVRRAQRRG
jgi:hypothetical protein